MEAEAEAEAEYFDHQSLFWSCLPRSPSGESNRTPRSFLRAWTGFWWSSWSSTYTESRIQWTESRNRCRKFWEKDMKQRMLCFSSVSVSNPQIQIFKFLHKQTVQTCLNKTKTSELVLLSEELSSLLFCWFFSLSVKKIIFCRNDHNN